MHLNMKREQINRLDLEVMGKQEQKKWPKCKAQILSSSS